MEIRRNFGGGIVWVRYINGWELIRAIADEEIKDTKIMWTDKSTGISDLIEVSNKRIVWKPETFSTKCLTSKEIVFELIEEDIKELPELTSNINYDTYSIENNRHKINELVRAVNKMRKEME